MAEGSQMAKDQGTDSSLGTRRGIGLEVGGEIVLLGIVGSMFAYLLIESFSWPFGAALMPRIAVAIGAPFWLWRLVSLIRKARETPADGIMDLGFRTGADPKGERLRFFRIIAYIVGLYLAIWLLGFHIAIPLGVAGYVYIYGRAGLLWSVVVGLCFLGLIMGVYDHFLGATWHEPPILTPIQQMLWD